MIGRILGWIFVAFAIICFGADSMAMLERGRVALLPLGDLWQTLDAAGYGSVKAAIETYTLPVLWNPVVTTVLAVPGLLLFGAIGLALLLLFRRREAAGKRFS